MAGQAAEGMGAAWSGQEITLTHRSVQSERPPRERRITTVGCDGQEEVVVVGRSAVSGARERERRMSSLFGPVRGRWLIVRGRSVDTGQSGHQRGGRPLRQQAADGSEDQSVSQDQKSESESRGRAGTKKRWEGRRAKEEERRRRRRRSGKRGKSRTRTRAERRSALPLPPR